MTTSIKTDLARNGYRERHCVTSEIIVRIDGELRKAIQYDNVARTTVRTSGVSFFSVGEIWGPFHYYQSDRMSRCHSF